MTVHTDKKAPGPASVLRGHGTAADNKTMYFYQDDNFITELSDKGFRHIVQIDDIPVAQLENEKTVRIFQKDYANTVLAMGAHAIAYTPYGYLKAGDWAALLAFNGQRPNSLIEAYALGNGNRIYRPALFSFTSPDPFSPFLEGGLNAYAYCQCDPVNKVDASGNIPYFRGTAKAIIARKREQAAAQKTLPPGSPGNVGPRAPSLQQRPLPEPPSGAPLAVQRSPGKHLNRAYRSPQDAEQAARLKRDLKAEKRQLKTTEIRQSLLQSSIRQQRSRGNNPEFEVQELSIVKVTYREQLRSIQSITEAIEKLRSGNDA